MPQPILPQAARPTTVQPQAGNAFALPTNFTLKPRGSGQPLPEPIQKKMESFFNTSFADVRVHVGHEAPSIGALAFTHGTDLYFAPGQYNPQSTQGQQLLGHELTHVVQQRAGRVRNPLGTGVAVVQDPALEAEAERMGLRAASSAVPIQAKPALTGPVVATMQAAGLRPNTVAANGAILPARSIVHGMVQRRTGPILPGQRLNPGKTDAVTFSRSQVRNAASLFPPRPPISTSVLQRTPWKADGTDDRTKAALSAELRNGVEAAVASPAAVPDTVKTWVKERVKEDLDYDTKLANIDSEAEASAEAAWLKAREAMMKGKELKNEPAIKSDFVSRTKAANVPKLTKKLDDTVHAKMRDQALTELKWRAAFQNTDGDLPGVAGAGGYDEYYAKPDPADAVAGGFWGQNRVLHAAGGTWYVTADHYEHYLRVTDA